MTNRRSFLAALGAGCALANKSFAQSQPASRETTPAAGQLFWTTETTSGKVQGISNSGIAEFKGIPYGAPTGGKNRYMPPRKPAAWTGVRECLGHGQISPQTLASLNSDYAMLIQWDLHVGGMGEDCRDAGTVRTGRAWTQQQGHSPRLCEEGNHHRAIP